jgi:hypothetical protein
LSIRFADIRHSTTRDQTVTAEQFHFVSDFVPHDMSQMVELGIGKRGRA